MTLAEVPFGQSVTVASVGGGRVFRRRLLELGLLPGVAVAVVGAAPLGDPLELEVRGCRLSIRRHEAAVIQVALPEIKRKLQVLP